MDAQKMLEDQGVELEDLVDAAFALYVGDKEKTEITRRKAMFRAKIRLNLQDQNVGMLLEAAIHLDKMASGEASGIFGSSADPSALVADELIGMSIAEYIAGKKGLFNYVRYDREKPGILARLPPFLDDAVGALVAGTMTRVFEE